jgi:hypothetical protein
MTLKKLEGTQSEGESSKSHYVEISLWTSRETDRLLYELTF